MEDGDGDVKLRTTVEHDAWGARWIVEREERDGLWIEVSRVRESSIVTAKRPAAKGTAPPNAALKTLSFTVSQSSEVSKIFVLKRDAIGTSWLVTYEMRDEELVEVRRIKSNDALVAMLSAK
jgi:hypothetical protein